MTYTTCEVKGIFVEMVFRLSSDLDCKCSRVSSVLLCKYFKGPDLSVKQTMITGSAAVLHKTTILVA